MGKISYERRAYESVDDRSLPSLGYFSSINGKNNSGHEGLTVKKKLEEQV